ncbi:Piso0_005347 [Millerozyma farinosa CBS 7064]|uniref:E3 ubiquitin protein ligase n=1 Tax=Pichia sorbitophila (strain ATCC MYA-4447 / BCRC 22081 / CBS 7064 / NBRC 10061 / NRRL Y-12695) TaxID=559304 RepID=G8Y1Y0_PICSO|nr:Piso0_005347 [Millerozyma farinosa CBS 7064]
MEGELEKKRVKSEDEGPTAKKPKVLDELSEEGPLTQGDVVYFKKEAIWRQMKAYKEKSRMLSRQLENVQSLYETNEKKLNVLDSWYGQVINLIKFDTRDSDLNESLLIRITNVGDSELDSTLEKRRVKLLEILGPIVENSKISDVEKGDLFKKIEELNNEVGELKTENSTLSKLRSDCASQIEDLQNQVLSLMKQIEREKSATLKRVDESMSNGAEVKQEEKPDGSSETKNGQQQDKVDSEEYEKLHVKIEELKGENELISKQLEETKTKYQDLFRENLEIKDRLDNLNESDLKNHPSYQEVLSNNQHLSERVSELQKINDSTIQKLQDMEGARDDFKNLINKELSEECESMKAQLEKSESDLARIRTARDELLSKQSILKSELEKGASHEQLDKMNKILNERIKSLESQREGDYSDEKLNELSKEEVVKRAGMLYSEIKEIEQAFQQTREISMAKLASSTEQESLIKKLTVEKTKADQKYFASMRYKDALTAENKVLKSQLAKSQELVNKLNELEKSYNSKIQILTKSNAEFKAIKESSLQENTKFQETIKTLTARKSGLEQELSRLKSSLQDKVKESAAMEQDLSSSRLTVEKLDRKLRSTESLLKKYKSKNTSSILQEDEKQLEALRAIAKCSVCSKNWKDTVLTVCGHVFCHACTQERLAARLRRCPSCNKGFSANDLLSIHL